MRENTGRDFYEIQRQQWRKSLFLVSLLILFYFLLVGFVSLAFALSLGLFLTDAPLFSGNTLIKILLFDIAISIIIAFFHFYDARLFGARFILKRLQAARPDLHDIYHRRFANTVKEMSIACGLPEVIPFVIPAFAINSMAVIGADKTPSVIVTEGLLAEFTRDELQAVVAHELAHVIRGDTFYVTLVCSLANFFERIRQALEPEFDTPDQLFQTQQSRSGSPFLSSTLTISVIIMRLLSMLISRQREILADATAVELSRNPRALARAIFKAHLKNSFVGDFNFTYSPLFIVPPGSDGDSEGFFGRAFSSHPSLMKRIKLLADMTPTISAKIIEEVWDIQDKREEARTVVFSPEEIPQRSFSPKTLTEEAAEKGRKVWSIRDPHGNWLGPFALEELLFLRFFTPMIRIRNEQEGIQAVAREFPQIRNALQNLVRNKPINPAKHNRCPRCRVPLTDGYYEGIALKTCPRCHAKLVESAAVDRIIARKEVAFSDHLIKKAQEFKQKFMMNPARIKKINPEKSLNVFCPNCGGKMLLRPYNYQYVVPVDKCLSCHKIWFDTDELEILQILIENRSKAMGKDS